MGKCNYTPEANDKILGMFQKIGKDRLMAKIKKQEFSTKQLQQSIQNVFKVCREYEPIDQVADALQAFATKFGYAENVNIFPQTLEDIKRALTVPESEMSKVLTGGAKTTEELSSVEKVIRERDVTGQFLDKAYGTAREVRVRSEQKARVSFVNALLIDRSPNASVRIINNNAILNQKLRNQKEKLFKTILDYLKNYIKSNSIVGFEDFEKNTENLTLFKVSNPGGKIYYTGALEKIRPAIEKFIAPETLNSDTLIQLEQDNPEKLNAYNALILLDHFDEYLHLKFGKLVKFSKFGEMSADDVYAFVDKGSNNIDTWRENDDIDITKECPQAVQDLIETTRLYSLGSDTPKQIFNSDQYLKFSDLSLVIGKLKEDVYNSYDVSFITDYSGYNVLDRLNLSEETKNTLKGLTLHKAINRIRLNPQKYLSAIFELFKDVNTLNTLKESNPLVLDQFKSEDLDIMYSLYKEVFSNQNENSINGISRDDPMQNYYGWITQVCDSIFKINFMQYYLDDSGVFKARNMSDTTLDAVNRSVRTTLRSTHSSKTSPDFEKYAKSLEIQFKKKDNGITFTKKIGNDTLEIFVNNSFGVDIELNNKKLLGFNDSKFSKLGLYDFVSKIIGQKIDLNFVQLMDDKDSIGNKLKSLINLSSRVLYAHYLASKVLDYNKSISENQTLLSESGISDEANLRFDKTFGELDVITDKDSLTIENISKALGSLQGLYSSNQIKSGNGNSQSQYSLSRLLGSWTTQRDEQCAKGACKNLFIIKNPDFIKGIYTAREFYSVNGVKDHTKFTTGEFIQSQFLYDYLEGLTQTPSGKKNTGLFHDGIIGILPSVNSDKNTIGRLVININAEASVLDDSGEIVIKPIKELSNSEFQRFISDELGGVYENIFNNIVADFERLFSEIDIGININEVKNLLLTGFNKLNQLYGDKASEVLKDAVKLYNENHRHNPIQLIDQVHFIDKKGKISFNQTLLSYLYRYDKGPFSNLKTKQLYANQYVTSERFWDIKKTQVIKSLVDANVILDLTKTDQPGIQNYIEKYKNFEHGRWIANDLGQIVLGYIGSHRITSKNDIADYVNLRAKDIVEYCIKNNKLKELSTITGEKDVTSLSEEQLIDALKNNKDNFISNANNLLLFQDIGIPIELNPELEKFNYISYLTSQEFNLATVGSCIAHPNKGKVDSILEEEAGRFQAQHKRNVSYTAAMQAFQLGMLNGIPSEYNIATLDDIRDRQYNITGDIDGIKPFDGATFVNPFVVYLENNSLCGAKAGTTKKQFVHFYDERTGTGGIIKTCGFGITNDWMRNSALISKMMYKMTNGVWQNENDEQVYVTNILKNYKDEDIQYFKNGPIYFKKNGKYWCIEKGGIEKTDTINGYRIKAYELAVERINGQVGVKSFHKIVGKEAVDITNLFTGNDSDYIVNSNYTLWELFGGKNALEEKGGKLVPSESSIERVVLAMNNIGIVKSEKVLTQDDLYQPLKHSDIHYCPTIGAVKQGAANINGANSYFDDKNYDFMKIKLNQIGIQLDKEHHADNTELSLMTQVINACSHRGYTGEIANRMYNALRSLTDQGTKELLDDFKEVIENDGTIDSINKLREAIINTVLKAMSGETNDDSLLHTLADEILTKARKGEHIKLVDAQKVLPIDNPQIYRQFLSKLNVFLTKSGIKAKIPGILSVLTPSHNLMKVHTTYYIDEDGNQIESCLKPEAVENQIDSDGNEISTETYLDSVQNSVPPVLREGNLDLHKLYQNRKYLVKFNDGTTKELILRVPAGENFDYRGKDSEITRRQMIKAIESGEIVDCVEWIKDGRDLGEYDCQFTTKSGKKVSIWDFNSVQSLFALKPVIEKNEIPKFILGETTDYLGLTIRYYDYGGLGTKNGAFVGMSNPHDGTINIDIQSMLEKFENKSWKTPLRSEPIDYEFKTLDDFIKFCVLHELSHNYILRAPSEIIKESDSQEVKDKKTKSYETRVNKEALELFNGNLNGLNYYAKLLRLQVRKDLSAISKEGKKFYQKHKVLINNSYEEVDENQSINIIPYELILPKTNATSFGLDEYDSIDDVRRDKYFFTKRLLKGFKSRIQNNLCYDFELKRIGNTDGDYNPKTSHLYILNNNDIPIQIRASVFNKLEEKPILKQSVNGKLCRVDQDGKKIYQIGLNDKVYIEQDTGTEIILTDHPEFYLENAQYNTIKISEKYIDPKDFIKQVNLVRSIKDKNHSASNWCKQIAQAGLLRNSKGEIRRKNGKLQWNTEAEMEFNNSAFSNESIDNFINSGIISPELAQSNYFNYLLKTGVDTRSSFFKSLECVASRTPSQSMQSFMPMKIVAFDNPDINTAYVSTSQIWLQGSDYDVDAVSIAKYDIDKSGKLILWSPYANYSSKELLDKSMEFDFPTGKEVELKEMSIEEGQINIRNYINNYCDPNKEDSLFKIYLDEETNLPYIEINENSNLDELIQFIHQVNTDGLCILTPEIKTAISSETGLTLDGIESIYNDLKEIVNKHNLYLSNRSAQETESATNNNTLYNMYQISSDPLNLIQSQMSVDAMTTPLKKEGNSSQSADVVKTRTPGNFANQIESIIENQVGKEGIGICAVGMKSFFGLTSYCNRIINDPNATPEEKARILINNGKGISFTVNGVTKTYTHLANVNPDLRAQGSDIEWIKKLDQAQYDGDAALILSAMLSLATDKKQKIFQ